MADILKSSGYDPYSTSRMSWMTHCAYPCSYPCSYPWFFKCLYFIQKWRQCLKTFRIWSLGSTKCIKIVMDGPFCIPQFVPLFVLMFVPLSFQMLIFLAKMKIMPQNFQDNILEVYRVHQERHGWPTVLYPCSYPCLYPWFFKCFYFWQKWR